MRNRNNIIILVVVLSALPGLAVQAQSIELSANADCVAWNTVSTLIFPVGVYSATLEYSVVLTDQDGAELVRFDWAGPVNRFEDPVMMLMHGGSWGMTLDSVYAASFVFRFLSEEVVEDLEVVCGEAGSEPCRQSHGFWKNNPDVWPVETLVLGDLEMDKDQLIQILRRSIRGHGSLLLARQLIAAKLNVANGCDDSINDVIAEADLFLVEHPLDERIWRHRVPSSRDLRIALGTYNKAGCPGSESENGEFVGALENKASAVEQTTFSGLKAMYR